MKPKEIEGQMAFDPAIEAETLKQQAEEWCKKYPYLWIAMVSKAKQYHRQNRRFSMETLFQFARYEMPSDPERTEQFKVNNNLRAALARKLLSMYPKLREHMDVRKSKVDWA